MKNAFLFLVLLLASHAHAAINEVWTCQTPTSDRGVRIVQDTDSAIYQHFLEISDAQVCEALEVQCPYYYGITSESWAWKKDATRDSGEQPIHFWPSVKGRYQEGLLFLSNGNGMKLVRLDTGSTPSIRWDLNWYFPYGSCFLRL